MLRMILILLCFPFLVNAQTDWTLKKEANQIKIYTRDAKDSNLKEFMAMTTIETPLKLILNELLEAPDYYEGCESNVSYYVKELNSNQHVFYAHQDLPWPIKDRDIVTLLTVDKLNSKTIKLTLESLPDELPSKTKTIRIKNLMGYWLLEEMEGKTTVTQQLFVDPEGSLPPFVVNNLLVKGPFKTFKDLRNSVSILN